MHDKFNGPSTFVRVFSAYLNYKLIVFGLELMLKLRHGYLNDLALSVLPSKLSWGPDYFIIGRLADNFYLRWAALAIYSFLLRRLLCCVECWGLVSLRGIATQSVFGGPRSPVRITPLQDGPDIIPEFASVFHGNGRLVESLVEFREAEIAQRSLRNLHQARKVFSLREWVPWHVPMTYMITGNARWKGWMYLLLVPRIWLLSPKHHVLKVSGAFLHPLHVYWVVYSLIVIPRLLGALMSDNLLLIGFILGNL